MVKGLRLLPFSILLPALLIACGGDGDENGATPSPSEAQEATTPAGRETATASDGVSQGLGSESLTPDQPMPSRFTCDGEDVSPALAWGEPPTGTQSQMLVMEDLDAPGGKFTHWLMHDLPANVRGLPEDVQKTDQPANGEGGIQIENDFGRVGYGGPCPPPGDLHRYEFKLIYLDSPIELEPGASREEVESAAAGHPIGSSSLIATYQR
jgi:hypothetical protein